MTTDKASKTTYASEQRGRTVNASYRPAEPQLDNKSHEKAARSVMHPDYHDPDWCYYRGALGH